MIKKRNQSLSERKKSKSSRKNTKSQIRQTDQVENDFYTEFQAFFKNAQNIHFNKFDYMKEFFNIGITDNPTDDQIMRIQRNILSTSGWATNLKKNWTLDEKKVLIWAMGKVSEMKKEDLREISEQSWEQISRIICRRDPDQCKQKWASMQKIALQAQPFTQEEDQKLYDIILEYQQADQGQKWSQIANDLNSNNQTYRSSKQCRERWLNHLNPNISKQPWCDDEDIQLLNFVKQQGRRWAEISKQMEGRRSENNLKNRFNSLIKREKDLTVFKSMDGSSVTNLDDLLSGCVGPEINDQQKQAIDVLLQKLHWRSNQSSKKQEPQKQKEKYRSSILLPEVKAPIFRQQQYVRYQVGHLDSEVNLLELTPCLVDMNKNMIYFCPSEILLQVINSNSSNQKDSFEKIKSEFSLFDVGFQKFKSTLSMIEELEHSQISISNNHQENTNNYQNIDTNELDGYMVQSYLWHTNRIYQQQSYTICAVEMEIRNPTPIKIILITESYFHSKISPQFILIQLIMKNSVIILIILLFLLYIQRVFHPSIYYELERIEGIKGEDNQLYVEKLMQFTNQLGVFELMIVFKLRETYTFFQELYITTKESSIYLVQQLQLIITSQKKSHSHSNMDTYTYNFASLYGGSFILNKSEQLENVGNILQDSKESYMMTECRQTDQFIVISLKEEIQLETVMFINQELFSSTIHHFQLFGSVVYPTNEWEYLGTFMAEDNNHWQIFTLQPHFLRYLKIHINDFYSTEFHCIVTQVKVFGQTVIGDLVQSHKKNLFKLKNTNDQKSIQDISSINNTYSEKPLNDEDDTMIQEYYESTSQCTYLDYFYLKTHHKQENDNYIRIVPYAANQSVFKVTSQNILIISHNQDLQKQSINQLQFNIDQQFKITQELDKSSTKFLKELEHQKQINIYLQDQLETYKHIFLISILIIIVINSAILIIVCNHQVISNKKFKKSTKSAISLRSNQEMYSDDDNKEIEAKTPIVKSTSSGNGNSNGNYQNYGKHNHKK